MKNWYLKTGLYLLLLLGYLLLYVINIEEIIYDAKDIQVKSTVDFVYQQF